MNEIYAFLAPVLLLLSVISFIIHFRNERKKMLVERPFHSDVQKKDDNVSASVSEEKNSPPCSSSCRFCRYCPIGSRPCKR